MGKMDWRVKGLGLGGYGIGGQTCEIDVDLDEDKIVRTRPLKYSKSYPDENEPSWSIKARGSVYDAPTKTCVPPLSLVYSKRATSRNRIPFPLKRVDWDPNGERNTQNRGKSKFERISWDEATQIIADEVTRVTEAYGPYSILCQGDGHGEVKAVHAIHSNQMNLLHILNGGYLHQARNPDSWEGWYWGARHVWGADPLGQTDTGNCLLDIAENTDTLLLWGCDMETTTFGWGDMMVSSYCFWLSSIGVQQIYICPDVNYGCAVHADKWIPVHPNTDAALQLAIIYTWLDEDLWDKEYVETHAVGMDWIEYYVSGREDGIPKTPKWAEEICGVPSRVIKSLARRWAKTNTSIGHCNGGSYIRSCFSSEPARLEAVCMGMQALGHPGRNVVKFIEWGGFGRKELNPSPEKKLYPTIAQAYNGFNYNDTSFYDIRKAFIPKTLVAHAMLNDYTMEEPLEWYGVGIAGWPIRENFNAYKFPNKTASSDIHMIWTDTPCWTTCWNGGNRFIQGIRREKIETVIVQHPWMENDCLYGDIILPISTKFELNDIGQDTETGEYAYLILEEQCINRVGDTKSDWEAVGEVAKKLGVYDEFCRHNTEEGLIKLGFETSGVTGYITWEEFKEKKYIGFGPQEGWEDVPRGMEPFYTDPIANPLTTPSGKLEFYSSSLATSFPDDKDRPPYPKYIHESEELKERRNSDRAKDYPFLLVSNHPRWRVHANLDDIGWLREIPTCKVVGPDGYQYEPVWINPIDAEELGIQSGDVVRLFNERGWVLGGAYVTERIRPGALSQDHGARCDAIEPGISDRGGANNLIAPHAMGSENTVAEVTSGFLVGIEKVDPFALAEKYPEAFGRVQDKGYGVSINNYLVDADSVCCTDAVSEGGR